MRELTNLTKGGRPVEKKAQKNAVRGSKALKLSKETIHVLLSSDLAHIAGGLSRSFCLGTDTCCQIP